MKIYNDGSIDHFDKEYFESILPKHKVTKKRLWTCREQAGQFFYFVDWGSVDGKGNSVGITVASSINSYTGLSGEKGEDSIRLWLSRADGKPLGSKLTKWITRTDNWEQRMYSQFSNFRSIRKQASDCPECGSARIMLRIKNGRDTGKLKAKCPDNCAVPWIEIKE